jgi:hypothetical protein
MTADASHENVMKRLPCEVKRPTAAIIKIVGSGPRPGGGRILTRE